jgi:hypothetical protein
MRNTLPTTKADGFELEVIFWPLCFGLFDALTEKSQGSDSEQFQRALGDSGCLFSGR